jgi:hypothetical protein
LDQSLSKNWDTATHIHWFNKSHHRWNYFWRQQPEIYWTSGYVRPHW